MLYKCILECNINLHTGDMLIAHQEIFEMFFGFVFTLILVFSPKREELLILGNFVLRESYENVSTKKCIDRFKIYFRPQFGATIRI